MRCDIVGGSGAAAFGKWELIGERDWSERVPGNETQRSLEGIQTDMSAYSVIATIISGTVTCGLSGSATSESAQMQDAAGNVFVVVGKAGVSVKLNGLCFFFTPEGLGTVSEPNTVMTIKRFSRVGKGNGCDNPTALSISQSRYMANSSCVLHQKVYGLKLEV